ncbi:MAG TPA: hypothetical protein VHL57_12975 [Flavobacteriales bacterium]|jgi:hypothetical protein|nr:hypothetical protein [Flavobacteriales bacterium]
MDGGYAILFLFTWGLCMGGLGVITFALTLPLAPRMHLLVRLLLTVLVMGLAVWGTLQALSSMETDTFGSPRAMLIGRLMGWLWVLYVASAMACTGIIAWLVKRTLQGWQAVVRVLAIIALVGLELAFLFAAWINFRSSAGPPAL